MMLQFVMTFDPSSEASAELVGWSGRTVRRAVVAERSQCIASAAEGCFVNLTESPAREIRYTAAADLLDHTLWVAAQIHCH